MAPPPALQLPSHRIIAPGSLAPSQCWVREPAGSEIPSPLLRLISLELWGPFSILPCLPTPMSAEVGALVEKAILNFHHNQSGQRCSADQVINTVVLFFSNNFYHQLRTVYPIPPWEVSDFYSQSIPKHFITLGY